MKEVRERITDIQKERGCYREGNKEKRNTKRGRERNRLKCRESKKDRQIKWKSKVERKEERGL